MWKPQNDWFLRYKLSQTGLDYSIPDGLYPSLNHYFKFRKGEFYPFIISVKYECPADLRVTEYRALRVETPMA